MSTTDWLMLGFLGPALLFGAWVQIYRLWRRQADISTGITWATGEASAVGAQAFALPGVSGLTLTWLGIGIALVPDGDLGVASVGSPAAWLMGAGFLLLLLGFWMWLFAWPRFLVPPHLRGRPGWVKAVWREWRTHRLERKEARAYRRRRVGDRSAR